MQVISELQTITVAWEPCSDFHDDAGDGCCTGCGWAPDDHDTELRTAA